MHQQPSLEFKLEKLLPMSLNALQLAAALRRPTITFTVTSTEFSSQPTNQTTPKVLLIVLDS